METTTILTQTLSALKQQHEVKSNLFIAAKWELKRLEKEISTIEKLIADANPKQENTGEAEAKG
jgi:predicted  nucleic acid-binding Zn-ribbon protein